MITQPPPLLAGSAGGLECRHQGARLANLAAARRQHAIDGRDVVGIDRALGHIAQLSGVARVAFAALQVRKGVGAVDRQHAGRRALEVEALAGIGKFDGRLAAWGAKIGRHVLGRPQHRRDAWARLGDGEGVENATRRLDVGNELGAAGGNGQGMLEARHLAVERGDLLRVGDLRHDDDVGAPVHDRGQIGVPFGFQGIDANGGNAAGGPPPAIELGGKPRACGRRSGGVKSSSSWISTSAPLTLAAARAGASAPGRNSQQRRSAGGRRPVPRPAGRRHGNRGECACIFLGNP